MVGIGNADRRRHSFFNNYYAGLNLRLAYTGGLLLAGGAVASWPVRVHTAPRHVATGLGCEGE